MISFIYIIFNLFIWDIHNMCLSFDNKDLNKTHNNFLTICTKLCDVLLKFIELFFDFLKHLIDCLTQNGILEYILLGVIVLTIYT